MIPADKQYALCTIYIVYVFLYGYGQCCIYSGECCNMSSACEDSVLDIGKLSLQR